MKQGLRVGLAGVVLAATSLSGVASAWAGETSSDPSRPSTATVSKERAAKDIAARLKALGRMSDAVEGAEADCGHNADLAAELADETTGLTALGETIAAETDEAALKEEFASIFEDYRVFMLEAPKTALVVGCAKLLANEPKLDETIAKAQTLIDKAAEAGTDVTAAQAAVDALGEACDTAIDVATEAADSVMSLAPDQGDEGVRDANAATVKAAHEAVKAARADLAAAVKAARQAVAALRASRPARPTSGSDSSTTRPERPERPARPARPTPTTTA